MSPHEGGPPRVVAGLSVAQARLGMRPQILCADGAALGERGRYWEDHEPGFTAHALQSGCDGARGLLARRAELRRWLEAHIGSYDLVHIHSLWRLVPTLAAQVAYEHGIPYLIAPHTAMSPWALAQKAPKKQLARWLVWNSVFRRARGFHALNDFEAAEIRAVVGAAGPQVLVVPNGVSLDEFSGGSPGTAPPASLGQRTGLTEQTPFVLFLARLHVMKGPDLLLEAFARIASRHPRLQLIFAGPDFGLLDRLRARSEQLQLGARVRFPGMVTGAERLWLLRNAICLAQPSRDEGFSLSILEGLAAARPVVISDRCKFPEVAARGAGIIVPGDRVRIADALEQYVRDPGKAEQDGARARLLIEQQYTWMAVGRRTQDMYERALAPVGRPPRLTSEIGLGGPR